MNCNKYRVRIKFVTCFMFSILSLKHCELRKQVPVKSFESEEDWNELSTYSLNLSWIYLFWYLIRYWQIYQMYQTSHNYQIQGNIKWGEKTI